MSSSVPRILDTGTHHYLSLSLAFSSEPMKLLSYSNPDLPPIGLLYLNLHSWWRCSCRCGLNCTVWICRGFGYLGKWQMSVKPASRRVASVVGNWRPMWHRWVQGVWSLEGVAEGFGPGSWQVAPMSGILQVQLCPDAKYMLVIGWGNGMSQLCFSTFLPVLVIGPEEWPHQMCLYRMVMFLYLLEVFMFMYCCIIGPELSFYVFIGNWLAGVAFPKYFCAFSSEGYKGVGSTLGCADCL